jgi:Zn-dependent membrane protease YugP
MEPEKKENLTERQKIIAILVRNRQLTKINLIILISGLLLTLVGFNEVGSVIVWVGIVIFAFTLFSNITAKQKLRKLN